MLFVIFLKFVERTRERCETSQKETNKENDKDEDRYGTINILFINLSTYLCLQIKYRKS